MLYKLCKTIIRATRMLSHPNGLNACSTILSFEFYYLVGTISVIGLFFESNYREVIRSNIHKNFRPPAIKIKRESPKI